MTVETKYNIGDEVWFIGNDSKIHFSAIYVIHFNIDENNVTEKVLLRGDYTTLFKPISEVFPTKEDLINSL